MRTGVRRRLTATGAALGSMVLVAALAGCSGDDDAPRTERTTPSATPTPYLPVPAVVSLTEEGEQLSLGRTATVAWQPRQDLVGAIRVSVDRIERTTFELSFKEWKVAQQVRTFTPYFVHALVTNVGDTDLAGLPLPLYGHSAANALVEPSTFARRFKPCHPSTLPKPFPAGASVRACLVYLVPDGGELQGVAFRPTEEFRPIQWSGAAATLTPSPAAKPKKKRKPAASATPSAG